MGGVETGWVLSHSIDVGVVVRELVDHSLGDSDRSRGLPQTSRMLRAISKQLNIAKARRLPAKVRLA